MSTRTYLLTLVAPDEPALRRTVAEPQLVDVLNELHRQELPADASLSVTPVADSHDDLTAPLAA